MTFRITTIPAGKHLDDLDIADDGTVSSRTGACKDIGERFVRNLGVADAREALADWSNGYLKSEATP